METTSFFSYKPMNIYLSGKFEDSLENLEILKMGNNTVRSF